MKKILGMAISFAVAIACLGGCENATQLRTASITEITASGSENYGVRVSFAQDKRLEGKGVDVQVKFSRTGEIVIWQENQTKYNYQIEDYDEWYSLTVLFNNLENPESPNTETFEKYEKAVTKTYLFNYAGEGKMEITLRAVAGDIHENGYKTGEILLDSTPISEQFTLKIK